MKIYIFSRTVKKLNGFIFLNLRNNIEIDVDYTELRPTTQLTRIPHDQSAPYYNPIAILLYLVP